MKITNFSFHCATICTKNGNGSFWGGREGGSAYPYLEQGHIYFECIYIYIYIYWLQYIDNFPDWKNFNDQAYSCPREGRLSALWGPNYGPSWNSSNHHSTIVLIGLIKGGPLIGPPPDSQPANGILSQWIWAAVNWRGEFVRLREGNVSPSGDDRPWNNVQTARGYMPDMYIGVFSKYCFRQHSIKMMLWSMVWLGATDWVVPVSIPLLLPSNSSMHPLLFSSLKYIYIYQAEVSNFFEQNVLYQTGFFFADQTKQFFYRQ